MAKNYYLGLASVKTYCRLAGNIEVKGNII